MYPRALSCVLAAALSLFACANADSTHRFVGLGGGSGVGGAGGAGGANLGLDDGGPKGPPPADAGGLCGNLIHKITTKPPTVYFVFDISGSMLTPVAGGTRYSVVQSAAAQLVKDLRYVIKAGAAAFPLGASQADPCHPGGEIYPPAFDDPSGFDNATKAIVPSGGTPTAATLSALTPKLAALPGKAVVVLATDGGPNCNAGASCGADECTENIEGCFPQDTCCATATNCCAPGGPAGPLNCIDHAATVAAVAGVAAAGVKVYVVGIPGSKPYASVLTDMAFAGGAPQSSAPFYYDVPNLGTLGLILQSIAGAEIPCDVTVVDPPPTQNDTNVYLDQEIVLSDMNDGWTWTSSNVITLHGAACAKLKSGQVAQVQVVSGCPTKGTK